MHIFAGSDNVNAGVVDWRIAGTAQMNLTMIYSGYHIGAWSVQNGYDGIKVVMDNMVF